MFEPNAKRSWSRAAAEAGLIDRPSFNSSVVVPMTARDRVAAVFVAAAGGGDAADRETLRRNAVEGGLGMAGGLVGCSITEMDRSGFRTSAFAGGLARVLDRRQYEAGVGPCVSATRDGQRNIVDDVAVFGRSNPWFAEAAATAGVKCVLSVPLKGLPALRSMNFYGAASAHLRDPLILARADLLSRALSAVDSGIRPTGIGETVGGKSAAARRNLLAQAQGIVMRRRDIAEEEAFYWLVRESRREDRSIFATAYAVVRYAGSSDS